MFEEYTKEKTLKELITEFKGLSPKVLVGIVNNTSDDQVNQNNSTEYDMFNAVINDINIMYNLVLPSITEEDWEKPYPSHQIFVKKDNDSIGSNGVITSSSPRGFNISFNNIVEVISISQINNIQGHFEESYFKVNIKLSGGNNINEDKDSFYIEVQGNFDAEGNLTTPVSQEDSLDQFSLVIDNSDNVTIQHITNIQTKSTFFWGVNSNGGVSLFQQLPRNIGEVGHKITIEEEVHNTHLVSVTYPFNVEQTSTYITNLSPIEFLAFTWSIPSVQARSVFVSGLRTKVIIAEGDYEYIRDNAKDAQGSLIAFGKLVNYIIPPSLKGIIPKKGKNKSIKNKWRSNGSSSW